MQYSGSMYIPNKEYFDIVMPGPYMFDEDWDEPVIENVYIKRVIYNGPATIIFWSDSTKTVAKCSDNDKYDREKGFCVAYMKKLMTTEQIGRLFEDWVPLTTENQKVSLSDVRRKYKS